MGVARSSELERPTSPRKTSVPRSSFEHQLQALAATCLELVRAANKTSVFGSIVPWQASPRP